MKKSKSIYVNCEAYFLIKNIKRKKHGLQPLPNTEERQRKFKQNHPAGEVQIVEACSDLTISEIKQILTDAQMTFREGEEVEYF